MPKDQNELPEIVGSKDLRETFKDNGRVRGSFFINNVELHQFEANSITGLLAALNARSSETFVTASIDDGYHLVLEANSPSDIAIRAGQSYQEPPPPAGDTAAAVKAAVREVMQEQRRKDENKKGDENTVLDDLGLEATDKGDTGVAGSAGDMVPAGMSAEDRRKARHERAVAAGAIRGLPADLAKQDWHGSRAVPQGGRGGRDQQDRRFNPIGDDRTKLPGSPFMEDANNPQFQRAPSSNSDRQPTVHDDVGRGPGS